MRTLIPRTEILRPIDSLKPHPNNARAHSEEQVGEIARSIDSNGFTQPILIDEEGTILAGHGRWLAARKLGMPEVPVMVIDGLTDEQKRIYLIADNQIGLNSTWDQDKLRTAVAELEKGLANLDLTGFRPQEIDRILADLAPEAGWIDEDEVPEDPLLATTVPGDVWILGRHRILCGDATLPESFQQLLQGESADMAFVDLPYNVNLKQRRGAGHGPRKIANDNLGKHFEEFLYAVCVQLLAVTRGAVYLCMGCSELHTLYKAFTAAGGHWSTYAIWAKDRFTLGRSDMQRSYEPILYGWKEGNSHYWCGARDEGDVWFVPKPRANRLHPTAKPVCLVERAIRNSSLRGNLVLDACCGAGSSLIACEKSGRRAAAMELEPHYVDVTIQRWEAYTHEKAQLEGDGRGFAAIANDRKRMAA
jgi:DNA modification methylase